MVKLPLPGADLRHILCKLGFDGYVEAAKLMAGELQHFADHFGHAHMALGIFAGADAYNSYSAKLLSLGPILIALEAGLVFFLLLHVILGIMVQLGNWSARPEKYSVYRSKGGMTVASRTMIWTGLAILLFIVIHLLDLKFGDHAKNAAGQIDLYSSTVAMLADPIHGIGYLIAVCLVGLHVSHAIQSSARTLGLNHDRYTPTLTAAAWLIGIFVAAGYGAIPVWVMMGGGQ